jgi:hypothetical protein
LRVIGQTNATTIVELFQIDEMVDVEHLQRFT